MKAGNAHKYMRDGFDRKLVMCTYHCYIETLKKCNGCYLRPDITTLGPNFLGFFSAAHFFWGFFSATHFFGVFFWLPNFVVPVFWGFFFLAALYTCISLRAIVCIWATLRNAHLACCFLSTYDSICPSEITYVFRENGIFMSICPQRLVLLGLKK